MIGTARAFGTAIRAQRKQRGLTQVELAEKAGVSRAWLARFETGHPAASIEQIFLVMHALELDLDLVKRTFSAEERAVLAAVAHRDAVKTERTSRVKL